MPDIDSALSLLRERLSVATGLPVAIGKPSTAEGLTLWPWRLVASDRNLSPPVRGAGGERLAPPPLRARLSVVVLASSGTAGLRAALAWATDNPFLPSAGRRTVIRQQSPDIADMSAIFLAGGIALAPALFWELEDLSDTE